MEFEYRKCIICGLDQYDIVASKDRHAKPLQTVICKGCGMVFINPVPAEKHNEQFYAREYRESYKGVYKPKRKHVFRSGLRALSRVQFLQTLKLPPQADILDIGSGSGEFVYMLKALGFKPLGLEPHEGYARFSKEVLDVNVENKMLQQAELAPENYDAITLHHVLEHLWDPLQALAILRRLLKPAGLLIVEVPNIMAAYHAPHSQFHVAHLFYFSPNTLEALARKAGLELTRLEFTKYNQHILAILKKADKSAEGSFEDPKNYEKVTAKLKSHKVIDHYFSIHPYLRPAYRLYQSSNEIFFTFREKSYTNILNKLVEKYKAQFSGKSTTLG